MFIKVPKLISVSIGQGDTAPGTRYQKVLCVPAPAPVPVSDVFDNKSQLRK